MIMLIQFLKFSRACRKGFIIFYTIVVGVRIRKIPRFFGDFIMVSMFFSFSFSFFPFFFFLSFSLFLFASFYFFSFLSFSFFMFVMFFWHNFLLVFRI